MCPPPLPYEQKPPGKDDWLALAFLIAFCLAVVSWPS